MVSITRRQIGLHEGGYLQSHLQVDKGGTGEEKGELARCLREKEIQSSRWTIVFV